MSCATAGGIATTKDEIANTRIKVIAKILVLLMIFNMFFFSIIFSTFTESNSRAFIFCGKKLSKNHSQKDANKCGTMPE